MKILSLICLWILVGNISLFAFINTNKKPVMLSHILAASTCGAFLPVFYLIANSDTICVAYCGVNK